MQRCFKITKAEVMNWHTVFSIKDVDHENKENSMSPEAFFHHIGQMCGRQLGNIQGLEFTVILPVDKVAANEFDPLMAVGTTINTQT